MQREVAIMISNKVKALKDRPRAAIPLSQGVRCSDLEKFLAWPTNSEHIKVVKGWADRPQPEAMGERI